MYVVVFFLNVNIFMKLIYYYVRDWIPLPTDRNGFLSITPIGEFEVEPSLLSFPLSHKDELLQEIKLQSPLDTPIMKSWHKPHDEWIKWIDRLTPYFEDD